MNSNSKPPQTHTEVYQLLVKILLKRHEEKSVKPPAAEIPNNTRSIPSKCELACQWMCSYRDHIHLHYNIRAVSMGSTCEYGMYTCNMYLWC